MISRLTLFKPKHGPKTPKVDVMTFTMTGAPAYAGPVYLLVTGAGIAPVGNPCPVQGGAAAAPPSSTSTVSMVS